MAVKATPNPPGTAELVERLDTLRGVLYSDRPKMGATETVRAAVAELGGTQEALTRLLTLCVDPTPDPTLTFPASDLLTRRCLHILGTRASPLRTDPEHVNGGDCAGCAFWMRYQPSGR